MDPCLWSIKLKSLRDILYLGSSKHKSTEEAQARTRLDQLLHHYRVEFAMFNGSRQATTLLKNAKQTEASRHALRGSYRQIRR